MAMFLPAGTLRFTPCSTPPFSAAYSKLTSRNSMAPASAAELAAAVEILRGLVEHFEDAGAGGKALLQRHEGMTMSRLSGAVVMSMRREEAP